MNSTDFEARSQKFFDAFLLFYSGWNKGQIARVEIKKQHSLRVSEFAGIIAASLKLDREGIALARTIGLLHDLGRFPQLLKYNTFDDSKSVDHAELGIEEMEKGGLFKEVKESLIPVIKMAVFYHNKEELPEEMGEKERLFSKILRDADKLDILQSLSDLYADPGTHPSQTMSWDVTAGRGITGIVADAAINGKKVSMDNIRTGDDIKVMQLSWVYDLNFKASFRILSRGQFVDKIYRTLPKHDNVFDIYRNVRIYVENQFMN